MVTFRNNNNNRRPSFRSNNNRRSPFRSSNEGSKFNNNDNFRRNNHGRNNHNAAKLVEKYNEMAREALAKEDRVMSENYFQHADHFTRVQNEQENNRISRINTPSVETVKSEEKQDEKQEEKKISTEQEIKKVIKTSEKKIATS